MSRLTEKTMTSAERKKASREWMKQEQRENDWKLCIIFLMSSSQFETFVNTNKLTRKLLEIGFKNAHEKDIAKLVFTVFHEFKSDIAVNLQEQMRSMLKVKFSYQKKLEKADETQNLSKKSYCME